MEVFRGECNFSQSSGVRRKGKSSTGGGGAQILNEIAHLLIHVDDQKRIFLNSINLSMQFQPSRIRVDKAIFKKKLWFERYLYSRYSKIRNLKLDFDGRSALVSF